jgi:hypothetical protein
MSAFRRKYVAMTDVSIERLFYPAHLTHEFSSLKFAVCARPFSGPTTTRRPRPTISSSSHSRATNPRRGTKRINPRAPIISRTRTPL